LYCGGGLECKNLVAAPSDGGTGTAGSCGIPALGDTCPTQSSCPKSAYCNKSPPDAGTGTCVSSSSGSPCGSDYNCPSLNWCDTTAHCAGRLSAGSPCPVSNSNTQPCTPPNWCVVTGTDGGGICGALGGSGAFCVSNGVPSGGCKIAYNCSATGSCTASGLLGQPCPTNGGTCLNGACTNKLPDGGGGTCSAYLTGGQACTSANDCASGLCDLGFCLVCP